MATQLRFVLSTCLLFLIAGCNSFTPPAQMKPINESGTYWLNYSSDRRGAIVLTSNDPKEGAYVHVCAEPAPDTSYNLEAQGGVKKDAIGEASVQIGQNTVILPGRNSNVLSLREALYRLCELSINRKEIPSADLLNSYNKVISAMTQYAEAETAKTEAATAAILQAVKPDTPEKTAVSAAKEEEFKGFGNLSKGDYFSALANFSNAEELYPGYHNAYEIRNALKDALKAGKPDEAKIQNLLSNIAGKWQWGVPPILLKQLKSQVK